jgi:hypothetical protein
MPVMESVARSSVTRPPIAAKQAVWVFESNRDGQPSGGAAAIAINCHGAGVGKCSGAAGSSYAIPTRDDENKLLPWDDIHEHVQAFRQYAESHPSQRFRILPSSRRKSDKEHARFADLFRNAPPNCELPGRWLELLERMDSVRIILLDANVRALDSGERKLALDQYFAANEGLWGADYVEIVSFGPAHTLVHNDKYAKGRGYRHRIISVDPDYYGDYAAQAQEQLSVAYATKLISLLDPMGTSTGNQVGVLHLAMSAGLPIDEALIQ